MKLSLMPTACLLLILVVPFGAYGQSGPGPAAKISKTLDNQVRTEVVSFKGKGFVFAKNLDTGESYSLGGDERVRTASTIKIAVMIEAFARVAEGKAKWRDELVLTKPAKVSGSGILQEFSDRATPDIARRREPHDAGQR